jgi:hypothetical protein
MSTLATGVVIAELGPVDTHDQPVDLGIDRELEPDRGRRGRQPVETEQVVRLVIR